MSGNIGLALLCLASACLSLCVGDYPVPLARVLPGLIDGLRGDYASPEALIIVGVRLPRLIAGLLVGAGLAASGTVLQAIFRNPLAEPGILGISAGGAFGAVLCLYLGLAASHLLTLPAMAFAAALGTAFLIHRLSTRGGRTPVGTLVLAGLAVSALVGAGTTLLLSLSGQQSMQEMFSWLMGGLEGRTWRHVSAAAPIVLGGSVAMLFFHRELDLLVFGEDAALGVGVPAEKVRRILLALVALVTAAAVATAGIIAFVGLVVPHILRLLVGPSHRRLLGASLLGGAAFLTLVDTAVRFVGPSTGLHLGVLTSLLGAPYFLFLLHRQRRRVEAIE